MRNFFGPVPALILALLFVNSGFGCARKTMSDRDTRREQLRINAHKKRQELAPLAGSYRGQMTDASGYKQDVSLLLELKDMPETEGGQVDPVLVPTLNGALSLTYGSGAELELFSFGTTKADFNVSDSRLDLVVSNTQFKEINLSLGFRSETLTGAWSAPAASLSGNVELSRTTQLNLGGATPPVRGTYAGIYEWNSAPYFVRGSLTFSTAQDGVDSFHVTASMKINLPAPMTTESYVYEFESVEFNPLTRQISIRSEACDIYFVGQLTNGGVSGKWFSKRVGLLGNASFSGMDMTAPPEKRSSPAASGSWFGTTVNTNKDSQLPERLMLSFNSIPDKSQAGGIALVGSARFYYGPYSSNEYLELRFETIDYQPFARRLVGVTQGSPKLTIQFDMSDSKISGQITDSSLGQVATFSADRQMPTDSGASMAGEYNGFVVYDSLSAFQPARISLVPSLGGAGLKLSAAATLFFAGPNSGESLSYRFDDTNFNSVTGLLTLSNEASDIVIKASIANGNMTGEWYSSALGRMGAINLSKAAALDGPADLTRLSLIKGTYQGSLRNTSPDTNLPERILFGIISTVDPAAPRGLSVTGNLRLYYGSFDSGEYVQLPFESIQFDPFRRTFTGKTGGAQRLTVQGNISVNSKIIGTLSDDSLGQVGTFEVERNVQ